MRGGWVIWLVSAAGSLAAHLGLVGVLSGMTLPPPPPPLADLYVGDAASEAPLEVEAVEDAATSVEAAATEAQVAAVSTEPQPVAETQATATAEALTPIESDAAATDEIAPRVPQPQAAEGAEAQAAPNPPAELPEATASPLTETQVQPLEREIADSPQVTEPPPDSAAPAEPGTARVEPEIADATEEAGDSPLADNGTAAPAIEPSADPQSTAAEVSSGAGEVDPRFSPSTEAVAPVTAEGTTTDSAVAVPETTTTQAEGVASPQAVAEARQPAAVTDQSATASVATGTASATVSAASPRQELKEPIASAATQPEDTSTQVEQQQQMAALPPVSELPMTQRERIERFAKKGFDLGACGLMEIAGRDSDHPRLNGFVTSANVLREIDNDFRRSVGVEPEIAMRQVMEAQCPAVNFIYKIRSNRAPSILVRLAADVVRGSDRLVGRLARATLPYTLLFIVDDDGIVHNLSDDLMPEIDGHSFAAEVHPTAQGKSRNQLIVAVGSTEPIDMPNPLRDGEAAPFLARLQANAAAAGARLSLGYAAFRVE